MIEHWYTALHSERGTCVRSNDREALRMKLYRARAEAADPELQSIAIVLSPTAADELWLVKKEPNGGTPKVS